MDQTATQSDHRRLSVPEIAEVLSVTNRTVYSLIDKYKWQKEVGYRGRVWYFVPEEFIEEYVRNAQVDQARSQQSFHNVSQVFTKTSQLDFTPFSPQQPEAAVTFTNDQFVLILGDKDSRINELKELLAEKDTLIADLRVKLDTAQNRVSRLEGEMSGKEALLSERDRVVDSLKETVSAKEQSVNATQAAYLNLQEQFHQLQEKQVPALPASASGNAGNDDPESRKTIWNRLLGVMKS